MPIHPRIIRSVRNLPSWVMCFAFLAAGLTALRAAAPAPAAAQTRRFFWKATSPTTEVYLLGSIHVATPDMYPLPPEIEAAYKASDNLVVEADVTKADPQQTLNQVMAQGMYGQGDSLDKHVSPETMKALQDFCATSGLPIQALSTMKPTLVALTVEELLLTKQGLSPDDGIDMHFLKAANAAKDKKIVELESADAQIKLLFSLDDALAGKWLAATMKDDSKDELTGMVKAWKEGDAKAIVDDMTKDEKTDPDAKKMNDLLIYSRNDGMVAKIDAMLKGKDKAFVVVGAAHLLGDKGIIKQLQAKGYKVEQPTLTAPPSATAPAAALPAAQPL